VWADDQWLVEHAGATLKKTDENAEDTDVTTETQAEENVETVGE